MFLVFLFVALVSAAVLAVQVAYPGPVCTIRSEPLPGTMCYLGSSALSPWGVVTAIFVHGDFATHYLPNMVFLLAFSLLFALTNGWIPEAEQGFRQRVVLGVSFLSAVVANALWLWLLPDTVTYGASGLDFAVSGVTAAFCLINALPKGEHLSDLARYYSRLQDPLPVIANFTIFAVLFAEAVFMPNAFLGVSPGTNAFAHGISFLLGMAFVVVVQPFHHLPTTKTVGG